MGASLERRHGRLARAGHAMVAGATQVPIV
jgi:hypothetical protein